MDKHAGSRKNGGARRPWLSRLAWLGWVLRYALAVAAVAAAMGLRVAMTAWLGSGLPSYITFYPAVMAVALLAGFGPGLWATVLAALATAYWVLPPSGQFAIASPVERVGLVIFIGMGLFMSVVAELYRRRRDKAAAYDQELALRESEERFRTAFEEGSVAMALTALDTTLLKVNARFCRMLGFSASELVGRSFTEITHPDDRAANLVGTRQLASGAISSFHMEKRYLRKDGAVRWVDMNTAAVQDAQGRPLYCVTQVQDITQRKRAEEALRASEERFRALTERGTDVVAILDPEGKVTYISPSIQALFGFAPEEIAGQSLFAFIHPEDAPRTQALIAEALRDPTRTFVTELHTRHKDGRWRWIAAAGRNLLADSAVGGIVANFQDITERKRAEEALRESEKRFRTMADGSPSPIWVTDAEGERIFANRQYREYFGISEQEVERGEWKPFLHPEDAPAYVRCFVSSLQERRPFSAEARVRRADGQWRWIESHAEPRLSAEGEFHGFVGITQDITERKQAEQELREWNATLESKVARRTAELQRRAMQLQKLTLELTQAEERERRRIALILHEDLQQQIAGARFHLSLVKGRTRDERLRAEVEGVEAMLKDVIEQARSLSRDLSPAVLNMNDLAEALQWLVNRVRARNLGTAYSIPSRLKCRGRDRPCGRSLAQIRT